MSETGYYRPSLTELLARIDASYAASLDSIEGEDQRSLRMALARVDSEVAHLLYGFIDGLASQALPDLAIDGFLARHAGVWGILRIAAEFAEGSVVFQGAPGAVVESGTMLQSADGALFLVTEAAVLEGAGPGTASAAVIAQLPGAAANRAEGAALNLVSPIAGVASAVLVAAGGIAGGFDAETDEAMRARLLSRIQQPPHGGADFDYRTWVREALPAADPIWVWPNALGLGTLLVHFMLYGVTETGLPGEDHVALVQDYIDARRPVCADPTVAAPVAQPVNYTIHIEPDSSAVRAAVAAELADLHRREASPRVGDQGGVLLISHIREAVSIAAGETDNVVSLPAADVTADQGKILTLGAITWV